MMKNLKKICAIILAIVFVLSLTACGGEKTVLDTEMYPDDAKWDMLSYKQDKPVTITMWIPNSATSTMGKGIQELADEFNKEQADKFPGKNINVVVEFQGTSKALNTKLQAAILSGNNPSISAIGVSSVPLYESKALDLRTVFTYKEMQEQNQGLLQYSMYDGKFILNPYFASASNILIVNKTLMNSKNVKLPTAEEILKDPEKSTWTWDEFKKVSKAVTDADKGVYGFATNSLDPIGMMFQQGGKLYNNTVTELAFTKDDKFKKGLEFWRSLVTEGCMLNPNARANHGTIIVSEFYEQKIGMIYTTSSNIVKFTEQAKANNYEIEVLPFPKQTNYFTNQGGSGIVILNNKPKEEIEASAVFLKWLNKPSSVAKMSAVSGYLPLNPKAMEEAELKAVYEQTPLLKTASEIMVFGVKSPQGKAKAACDSEVSKYAKYIWTEMNMSIDDIVKTVTERMQFTIEGNQ